MGGSCVYGNFTSRGPPEELQLRMRCGKMRMQNRSVIPFCLEMEAMSRW